MSGQKKMTEYLQQVIQGLVDQGLTQAVISPGSRSTPVALLLHRHPEVEVFIGVDERSAGFFAVGLSKASDQPVALVCTSGTAAANYFPAICEARAAQIPLLILTTDRPPELQQVGAPQTLNQLNLYGDKVKFFTAMAVPENTPDLLAYAYWQGAKLVTVARETPQAPVHMNLPLREPLLPDLQPKISQEPQIIVYPAEKKYTEKQVAALVAKWSYKKGLLVVGGNRSHATAQLLSELAQRLGWPILADPLATVRSSKHTNSAILQHYDLYMDKLTTAFIPELIVKIGPQPVSKTLTQWLSKQVVPTYFIDESEEWQDPTRRTTVFLQANESPLLQQILMLERPATIPEWEEQWIKLDQAVEKVMNKSAYLTQLTEAAVTRMVFETMADKSPLFVSNSMPIRHLDRFMQATKAQVTVYGNRGVNGIDGILSTASGVAAHSREQAPILLIGDLAFYHDMNGLAFAKNYHLPLTIVLLNNDGGGIFSFLSQRSLETSDFEPLFGTPLHLDHALVAQLYGATYTEITSLEQLQVCLMKNCQEPKFQILEVRTDRAENVQLFEKLRQEIQSMIEGSHYESEH